ncbi:MAG: WD40/YVTN/BNR-like repeat-containing protein [Acidobacteriaceae bacterium]
MKRLFPSITAVVLGLLSLSGTGANAQQWHSVGPYGGDARSFAYSPAAPSHVLLGTTNSWVYETDDAQRWTRLSKISASDSLVVDNIVFDKLNPKRVLVGAWRLDAPDGGVFISEDEGHRWNAVADMKGQSVRALAQAPSDPKIFVAGTLSGIYRSLDGGTTWKLISPVGSSELHEVESIAIDPVNPEVIYAGTWHLPWKTVDGGKNWQSIKQGLIVDSDVFSIIIDPKAPSTVYTSACSGIYKSVDAGANFHKIQGIPSSARRTRVLMQDPNNANVVYAGTTEGLYRTVDAGEKWTLMTPNDIIINDIYVDPKNSQHILMATDRSGILESGDGSVSFHDDNQGFSERQVSAMVADPASPDTLYVGVLNDKRFGGVFVSKDGGHEWNQLNAGLNGNDVFSLAMSPGGVLLAGTNHGAYRLRDGKWESVDQRVRETPHKIRHVGKKHRVTYTTEFVAVPDGKIEDTVHSVAFAAGKWYAATADGLYSSEASKFEWLGVVLHPEPVLKGHAIVAAKRSEVPFYDVAASGGSVFANAQTALYFSPDQAKTWQLLSLPTSWHRVRYVAVDASGNLWVGGRLGVAFSDNQGQTWQPVEVPINDISGLQYDPQMKRIVATSYDSDLVFGIDATAKHWSYWDPGWRTHIVDSSNGRLVAATLLHGVVAEQQKQLSAGSF